MSAVRAYDDLIFTLYKTGKSFPALLTGNASCQEPDARRGAARQRRVFQQADKSTEVLLCQDLCRRQQRGLKAVGSLR